jgi:integral membrane sensor domain MASE1
MILKPELNSKKISCPSCGRIVNIIGYPGEKKIVICPNCNTKGYFQFQDEEPKQKVLRLVFFSLPNILILSFILICLLLIQDFNELAFLFLLILIPIFVFFKFDDRMTVLYAIFLIFLSNGVFIYITEEFGEKLAILSYYLIIVGFCSLLVNLFIEKKLLFFMDR